MEFEDTYEYKMPEGFSQEPVKRPTAFILDRMQRQLLKNLPDSETEAYTARLFLACCSSIEGGA